MNMMIIHLLIIFMPIFCSKHCRTVQLFFKYNYRDTSKRFMFKLNTKHVINAIIPQIQKWKVDTNLLLFHSCYQSMIFLCFFHGNIVLVAMKNEIRLITNLTQTSPQDLICTSSDLYFSMIALTTFIPSRTIPNARYFPSKLGISLSQIENPVSTLVLNIDTVPG